MVTTHEIETQPRVADYRRVLRKHRWLMTGLFLLTVLTVAIWTFVQVPIYQAATTILIEPEPPRVLNIQDVTPVGAMSPWDPAFYPTQYEIIKSRAVVERAVEALGAKARAAGGTGPEPGAGLTGSLSVDPVRNTRLVLIRVAGADPARAAAEANAIANAYAKYNVELKLKGARDALAWLTEEAARLRTKVEESSQALQNYRIKSGILGMQEQRQISAQKIIEANKAYLEAQAQRMAVEAKLGELRAGAKDPAAGMLFSESDNPLVGKIKGEIAGLETERSKLLKVYKEKHPEIVKIDAQIQHLKERLDAELQSTVRSVQTQAKVAQAREDSLLREVNALRREGQELNDKESQYQNLQHEVESNQQLYDSVVKRLKETGVAGGLENSNVRIVEEATAPVSPIRPRKAWNLGMSLVAGLVLAFGVAFGLEYLDTTVKTPDDVERYLGLAVIGVVPAFHARRR